MILHIFHRPLGRSEPSRQEVERIARALSLPRLELEGLIDINIKKSVFPELQPQVPLIPTLRPVPIVGKVGDFWGASVEKTVQGWLPVHLPNHRKVGLQAFRVVGDHLSPQFPGQRLTLTDRKGGDDHVIPLMSADAKMLAARAGRARAAGLDTVWFRELKGGRLKALTYGGALQAMHRALRDTGLKASRGARVHDFRHHSGTRLMRATGNLRLAQRLLGHASIQSTIKYAYASDSDLREGLEKLTSPRKIPG